LLSEGEHLAAVATTAAARLIGMPDLLARQVLDCMWREDTYLAVHKVLRISFGTSDIEAIRQNLVRQATAMKRESEEARKTLETDTWGTERKEQTRDEITESHADAVVALIQTMAVSRSEATDVGIMRPRSGDTKADYKLAAQPMQSAKSDWCRDLDQLQDFTMKVPARQMEKAQAGKRLNTWETIRSKERFWFEGSESRPAIMKVCPDELSSGLPQLSGSFKCRNWIAGLEDLQVQLQHRPQVRVIFPSRGSEWNKLWIVLPSKYRIIYGLEERSVQQGHESLDSISLASAPSSQARADQKNAIPDILLPQAREGLQFRVMDLLEHFFTLARACELKGPFKLCDDVPEACMPPASRVKLVYGGRS
jgi:hypothetical protein